MRTNTMLKGCVAVIALALATLTLPARNAEDESFPKKQAEASSQIMTSSSFVKDAIQGNLMEIALADAAKQKAQSEDVKQFAERIRKDHTEANQKLQTVAQKNGITVEHDLDSKCQQKVNEVQQSSGQEFDQAFAKAMLKGHAKAISKYQQASQQLQDQDVKQYAQETLPTLQQHLTHGKDVAKNVGVDQATISSLTRDMPEGVGGTSESSESESGVGNKSDQSESRGEEPKR